MSEFVQWELELLHRIQDFATPVWNGFWSAITYFGESGAIWIVLALVLLCYKKTRKIGLSMAISLILGLIFCNGILKNWVARPRPYDLDPTLSHGLLGLEMTKDFSFPSGHTTASFEGATAIFLHRKKGAIVPILLAVLIAASRICLRVHYPSDVLAGALLGTLLGWLGTLLADCLVRKIAQRKTKKTAFDMHPKS